MLQILGQISIWGTKASLERLASIASIPSAVTKQVGLKRRVPETDSWVLCVPSVSLPFRYAR